MLCTQILKHNNNAVVFPLFFLVQVQRVSQYDKYVNELYNRTSPHHADAENLKEAASTVRSVSIELKCFIDIGRKS